MNKVQIILILSAIIVVGLSIYIIFFNVPEQDIVYVTQNDTIAVPNVSEAMAKVEPIVQDETADVQEIDETVPETIVETTPKIETPIPKDFQFIFCCYDQWWDDYKDMETEEVGIYYRTRDIGTIPTNEMIVLENKDSKYYYSSASSDYASYDKQSIHRDIEAEIIPVLERDACEGLYMHEALTYISFDNNWDWNVAVEQFDWSWANRTIYESKKRNKKVIWSEPSYAWQTVYNDTSLDHWFEEWGDTVIIMFATNFPDQIDASKNYAKHISDKFNIPFGESVQDWYFIDQQKQATSIETDNLCRYGYDDGVKYFQIEGSYAGMVPSSEYIEGIKDCINFVSS